LSAGRYSSITDFEEGRAIVSQGGKEFYIALDGMPIQEKYTKK